MDKTIIVTGNPVDGFTFIGPFEDHDAAVAYAEASGRRDVEADWWIAALYSSEEDAAKAT